MYLGSHWWAGLGSPPRVLTSVMALSCHTWVIDPTVPPLSVTVSSTTRACSGAHVGMNGLRQLFLDLHWRSRGSKRWSTTKFSQTSSACVLRCFVDLRGCLTQGNGCQQALQDLSLHIAPAFLGQRTPTARHSVAIGHLFCMTWSAGKISATSMQRQFTERMPAEIMI